MNIFTNIYSLFGISIHNQILHNNKQQRAETYGTDVFARSLSSWLILKKFWSVLQSRFIALRLLTNCKTAQIASWPKLADQAET